jgi:GH25 family lysozyme M1 (1,4-beta-N-acetylmuramidase)
VWQDVLDYAVALNISEAAAPTKSLQEKAIKFVKKSSEVYSEGIIIYLMA